MQTLMKHGFEREKAFEIMEAVGKGGAAKALTEELVSEMMEKGVGDAFVEALRKIKYAFPRSNDVELAIRLSKLLWFRVHFPKEYASAA